MYLKTLMIGHSSQKKKILKSSNYLFLKESHFLQAFVKCFKSLLLMTIFLLRLIKSLKHFHNLTLYLK